jgi:hypothetical protein
VLPGTQSPVAVQQPLHVVALHTGLEDESSPQLAWLMT